MVPFSLKLAFAGVFLLASRLVSASPADSPILPLRIVGSTEPAAVRSKPILPCARVSSGDSLVQIGEFYPGLYGLTALGDTDHDYQTEIVVAVKDNLEFTYRVLENQGDDVYEETYRSTGYMIPSAIADLNSNGREEIIGQYSYYLEVYESPDYHSHPSQLLWSSPPLSNVVGVPTVGDTDRDGRLEIIHSVNGGGNWLIMYEWDVALNTFASVYDAVVDSSQQAGRKVISDFDGDGLMEIALGGTNGRLHVLESPANDTWMEIFTANTGLSNAYGVAGGEDVNRNGRPEIFIVGDDRLGNNLTYVYEATGDNDFARVDSMAVPGDLGGASNGIAHLYGPGSASYILANFSGPISHLRAYEIVGHGSWVLAQDFVPPSTLEDFAVYDANLNSRDEIFWVGPGSLQSSSHSIILEVPRDATSVAGAERLGLLKVRPSPCRLETSVKVPVAFPYASDLVAYDVSGREIDRRMVTGLAGRQVVWPAGLFPAGIYILAIEDRAGSILATGRVVIVR